jgi:hypothetical protein
MFYPSIDQFLTDGRAALAKGPVALVFCEDEVEIATTLRHVLGQGFKSVLALVGSETIFPDGIADSVHHIQADLLADGAVPKIVNAVIAAAPGIWLHYCYNAEYLFYPFCEHRSVGEMTTFVTEERRDSVLTYVIDLYASDLWINPDAVSLEDAHLDKSGYYALARSQRDKGPLERQLDFFGGLRWRFEEHIPAIRRRIDRISLFRAVPGLQLQGDHTFNVDEYNTYACPWHNSITASVCSFRTAKALKRNPGSTHAIPTFRWHNSAPFAWHSQQLLDLGLMEPGQWF